MTVESHLILRQAALQLPTSIGTLNEYSRMD